MADFNYSSSDVEIAPPPPLALKSSDVEIAPPAPAPNPVSRYGTPSAHLPGTRTPFDLTAPGTVPSGFGGGTVAPAGMGSTGKTPAITPAPTTNTAPKLVTPEEAGLNQPVKGYAYLSTTSTETPKSYLKKPTNKELAQQAGEYTTGKINEAAPFLVGPFQGLATGPGHLVQGAQELAAPDSLREAAGGLGHVIQGGFETLGPAAGGAGLVAAPLATAATIGVGMAAQEGTAAALHHLGVAPEYADLAGDIAGIAAGYGVHATANWWLSPKIPPEVRSLVEASQSAGPSGDTEAIADQIAKITRLATHPNTPASEAAAARAMLLRKFGINIPEPNVAPETVPQQAEPEPQVPPPPQYNSAEFTKAHNVWNSATNKAATSFMEANPGVSFDEAKQAVAGTVGVEPTIDNYKAPPPPPEPPAPAPEVKPEPPAKVEKVSPATPNAPTAATPTQPESPETIALQMEQMGSFGAPVQDSQRKAVMFPGGQGMPDLSTMAGLKITHDAFGNVYAYRPDLIAPGEIHAAAKNNTLTEVLGGPMGMGAPDKANLQGPPVAVVGKAPNGTEAQTTVTDAVNLPQTVAATHAVTPVGGTVEVKTPDQALAERGGSGQQPGSEVIPSYTAGQVEIANDHGAAGVPAAGIPAHSPESGAPRTRPLTAREEALQASGGRSFASVDPKKMSPAVRLEYDHFRDLLKQNDNLGFDTTSEAVKAILMHQDWADRWDTRNEPDLVRLGNLFGGWGQPEPVTGQPSPPPVNNSQAIRAAIERGKEFQDQAKFKKYSERKRLLQAATEEFNKASALNDEQKKAGAPPSRLVTPQVPNGIAGATPLGIPLSAREASAAAKKLNIDTSGYDLKTIEGRNALATAIQKQKLTKVYKEPNATEASPLNANNPNLGTEVAGTPPADIGTSGAVRSAVSKGNGSEPVRGHVPMEGAANGGAEAEPVAGHGGEDLRGTGTGPLPAKNEPVRKITGSADIPLSPAGERQVEHEADTKIVKPLKFVISAPSERGSETAAAFAPHAATVSTDPVFDGWARGSYEGQPMEAVKDEMSRLTMNPDEVPPGVSPISGEPGKSWNEMAKPMFAAVARIHGSLAPNENGLIVTSGGNLQAIDAWGKAGYPADFEFDHAAIAAQPYWSVTGKMFRLGANGLDEVADNSQPGLNLTEHGETAYNSKGGDKGVPLYGGAETTEPIRSADNGPLAQQLPGTGEATGRPVAAVGGVSSGSSGDGERTGTEQGAELGTGAGIVSGVVGNPAEPELTFPPRGSSPTSTTHDGDYRIPNGRVVSGSPEARARTNIAAIKTLRQIQTEERAATVEEQKILAGYVDAANAADAGTEIKDASVEAPEGVPDADDEGQPESDTAEAKAASSVTLGSGLGAFQPFYEKAEAAAAQFAREEVLPKVAAAMNGSRDMIGALVHIVNPRRGVRNSTLDTIYRMTGGREAANFLMASQLDKWSGEINKLTRDEMVDFIDRQKTGQPQTTPDLQNLSDFLRRSDDALYTEISKYSPSTEYLENHYRVLWKVIPGSPQALGQSGKGGVRGIFRRPLQGTKGFLKQHKLADMSEGLELGGVPYSYNPVVMFQKHYEDAMKYITARRLWAAFQKTGVRKFVRFGKQPPEGYVKLSDPISKAYFSLPQGVVDPGDWYVEEGAARLLNNMLGRDYLREVYADAPKSKLSGNLGKFLLAVKNNTTAIELALSPFHAVFEANEAIGSQIGIGMREIWNLGIRQRNPSAIGKGIADIATAPGAAVSAAKLGSMAKQSFGNIEEMQKSPEGRKWLNENAETRENIPYFFSGGGKMGMPEDFRIKAADGFKEYLASARAGGNLGHYVSAGIRSIPAFNRAIMSPLFEHYIPNLKLGFFLKEFALAKQEYADRINSGEMTLEHLSRNVIDSVENRFGEMNFDNLFWDRTFKTAAQIMFRSITWKLGNIRANFGALAGQISEIRRAVQTGEIPRLHSNMGWFIGMALWTTILGSVIHMLGTGHPPHEAKDVIYPVIDPITGIRVSIPTYIRDLAHLKHDPGGYVKSSLSGDLGKLADIWENRDFYGNEVYGDEDPLSTKILDSVLHFTPTPFSISSRQQAQRQGGNGASRAAGFLGFTKAPRYIEQTPAEQMASDYAANHREVGHRTSFDTQKAQARTAISANLRRGGEAKQEIAEAESKGLISKSDVNTIKRNEKIPALVLTVRGLTMPEALRVYDASNTEERKEIKREVNNKVFRSMSRPAEFGKPGTDTWTLAAKYFKAPPVKSALSTPQPIQ